MAYYLVDYENVKADGMCGVDQLGKKDVVCIFYSENASTLTFGLHENLNRSKAKILLQKVEVGVKNALAFQLSTYLGYLVSENEGKNETYYIVSEDKGLAILTGYWADRGENVKTAPDIAAAKEEQEEEKTVKAEKKEKKEKTEETKKVEKESDEKKEESRQQKKFHEKKQQKKGNHHPVQATRLQVHTRKQEEKTQESVVQEQKAENREVPATEKMLTEAGQEQPEKEAAVRQEDNSTGIRKPVHRRYRKYRNYRKYPQKNRKQQESSKVIRPILSAGE